MKIVINKDGQKRYRFEDTDLELQRSFEKAIFSQNTERITEMIVDFLGQIAQRSAEAWRNAITAIKELDPEFDGDLAYDHFIGEFRKKS